MLASGNSQLAIPVPLHIEQGEFSYSHILSRTSEINDYTKKSRDRLAAEIDESECKIAKHSLNNFRWHLLHFGRPIRDSPAKLKQMICNTIGPLAEEMHKKIAEYRSYIYSAKRAYVSLEDSLLRRAMELEQSTSSGAGISAKIAVLASLEKCRQTLRILDNTYWELDRLSIEIDSRTESLYVRLRSITNALILTYSAWMGNAGQASCCKLCTNNREWSTLDSIWLQKLQVPLVHVLCSRVHRDDFEKAIFETLVAHESYPALRVIASSDAYPSNLRMRAKSSLYDLRCSLVQTSYERIMSIKKKPAPNCLIIKRCMRRGKLTI